MKKKINVKILLLIFIFVLNIVFGIPGQNVKAADNAPVLHASGNIATFIKGQSEVNVDPNITLTGIDNIDGARIYIGQGFDKNEDSLVFTNQNNITGEFDSATGVLTLSGVDTTANYQTALRSIKYINSSSNPSTAQRKIVFSIGEKVLYCPPTKHYYEYVSSTGVRWDTAKTDAESKNYYGLKGYLVTITSEEENDFIKNKIAGNTWIGASDDVQLGKWTWRTGPEAGQCFWDRTTGYQGKIEGDGNYTYNDMYNNWDSGEPNNYQGIGEYYAHMYSYSGNWNDFKIDNPTIAGYVVEYSEINPDNPTLQLVAEVTVSVEASSTSTPTLSASPQNADNMINLNWNPNDSTQTYKYMVSKRDVNLNETNYQTIPLNETAKVLNIYPGGGTAIAGVTDLDGRIMDTSGSAKQWMQNYGNGKITVDSVYIDNFSINPDKYLKDINGNYKYDVVFVGSWDSNNYKDISPNARTAIQAFINAGGGYLAGHDTSDVYDKVNLVNLAENNMNMVCNTAFGLYGGSSGNVNISVAKKGSLTNYPWNLSSNTLNVPASHTTNQFAKGYVWMTYDSSTWGNPPITSYDGSTGTNNFYLTTWNNTAMIQTGHSNGEATVDEQKILANTLLYLSQVSLETSFADHTAQDVTVPNVVSNVGINIDGEKKAKIAFDAAIDSGNTYEYQLKAFGNTDKKTYTSNVVQSSITSGIKGYALVVDKNSSTDPGNSVTTTSNNFTSDALTNGTWYVHIKAIDNAGNASSIVHKSFDVDGISPKLTLIPDTTEWTNGNVNVKVEVSDEFSGVKEVTYTTNETVPQTGTVSIINGVGTIELNKEGQYDLTVTAKDNSLNEVNLSVNVKIDNTLPTIESVTGNPNDWTSNDVILTVDASDAHSGLAAAAYSFDGGSTWQAENTKTYTENTSNIVVKVRDVAGNIATYNTIDITKIDKTGPNTPVIENSNKYVDNNWYNDSQTITAKFTATAGSTERLQYKVNTGTWTEGESVTISTEGKNDVSFRVIDTLGLTSSEQTVKVNIDKIAPTNAKITVKDREFTSILNKITFGIFFKDTVNVTISADDNMSGINKIEYQKVAEESGYNPNGTWTSGNSFNVVPDEKFVVYAKVTDNAGNYVVVNSDGVVVDATNPELTLTPDTTEWTNGNVNVKVEVSDKLAGVKEVTYTTSETVPQTGTVSISNGVGTITLNKEGQYELTVTAKDNSLNKVKQSVNVKIDKTIPKISGVSQGSRYFIGRVIKVTDNFGEVADVTYKLDTNNEVSFSNEVFLEKIGKYMLTLKDKAGNSTTLAFEIKPLPKVESIVYTEDCKALIENIRAEFDSHNDLTEPYKTKIDSDIKVLEARYSQIHKEVEDIKTETSIIKSKIESLPKGTDGLLNLNKEIWEEYNKIVGNTSSLTVEQKLALVKEAEYLKQQLDIIAILQNQIDSIKTSVLNLDTKLDGLISKEGIIKEILGNVYKLTKEQQQILQPEVELLNSLIDKNNVLKKEVEDVKGMISKLPSSEKITKQDSDLLISIDNLYNKLTNEQKSLVGEKLVKHLKDCLDSLSKLMLYDEENEITITGVNGTKFDSKVYLVVTPFKEDNTNTKFITAFERVKNVANTLSEIKDKELVALYDITLFKDNVKIQPEGKVEVRIKIPENLSGRSGLDIIHIADDGMVTPMHAMVENGYLVFITTHFSEYAIVADPIEKTIPKAGNVVGSNILIVVGGLLVLSGLVIITRKRRRV